MRAPALGQVIEAQRRHLGPAELFCGEQPAMAGDDIPAAINEDRDIEAEGLNAAGDFPDLLLRMTPRVCWISF